VKLIPCNKKQIPDTNYKLKNVSVYLFALCERLSFFIYGFSQNQESPKRKQLFQI